ncbi:MAG TPA: TetR/AcrR family transcriptional regulator [Mycobacteriales bacterium]|nr:TetR/AcrR family transcriptional regulator [Mycobacteriales bacterium]
MAVTDPIAPAPGVDRRRRLLESSLAVFTQRGYAASRVEDVCAEASVSRATFYRYFDSKDEVFDALIELMCAEVLDSAAHLGAVTPDADGKETLARWIADLVAITERWGALVDEVNLPRASNPVARERAVLLTSSFADVLADRFTEGGVAGVDPKLAALAIIAMTERTAHQVRTWDVDIDNRAMVDSLATLAMKMLHPVGG